MGSLTGSIHPVSLSRGTTAWRDKEESRRISKGRFKGVPWSVTIPSSPNPQKALGAYYTHHSVAEFLAHWAICQASDTVLEPSFGAGAFLRAAAERLNQLGAVPGSQIWGMEIDPVAHDLVAHDGARSLGMSPENLILGDFFTIDPEERPVSVVIGNPPFVRYQRFVGDSRQRALRSAAAVGVELSELSSSWAPFLIHATRFLNVGGRLGMVVPLELMHAAYARPVLKYLRHAFSRTNVLTFDRKLFPELNQDTLLVLAEGFSRDGDSFRVTRLPGPESLAGWPETPLQITSSFELDGSGLEVGGVRAAEYRISPEARRLYLDLEADSRVSRLGSLADVGIGYVTGANDYFHLTKGEVAYLGIRPEDLVPAVRRGRDLSGSGLGFSRETWRGLLEAGGKYLLFYPSGDLEDAAQRYVELGERISIPTRYKCRTRDPWWKVPSVIRPDMLLTVMSGHAPRLVANDAGVVATNTLHTVRLRQPLPPKLVAAASVNTLTLLSAEIEGHALGGGMLKLEPSEAERVLLPFPMADSIPVSALAQMDQYLCAGKHDLAVEVGDQVVLTEYLGLDSYRLDVIRQALHELRSWRQGR